MAVKTKAAKKFGKRKKPALKLAGSAPEPASIKAAVKRKYPMLGGGGKKKK